MGYRNPQARARAAYIARGGAPLPTPMPGPNPTPGTPANLAQVSNTMLATNAGQTWWSTQQEKSPVSDHAVVGSTSNTGLMHLHELTASTRAVFDARVIETPNFFTPDEHNAVAVTYTPNGALWVAVTGHSNAVNPTAANQGRVLVLYSATGRIADLQQAVVYPMTGTTTTQGANYAQWRVRSNTELMLWTNNDAAISWKPLRFSDGDYKSGQWLRAVAKNKPAGTGGENQLYMLASSTGPDTERLYFHAHASNAGNIIRVLDFDWVTGNVYKDGTPTSMGTTSLGSIYSGTATMYDFTTDTGAVGVFNPGASSSVRMMDARGFDLVGATYVTADGSNPQHVHISNTTAYPLGSPGPAFDLQRFYYRGIVFGREPHTGELYYRCATDGSNNDLCEKVTSPTVGGTLTRETIMASSTSKILRPFAFRNATSNLALAINSGTYVSYTNFTVGMVLSNGAAVPLSAPVNASVPTISGSPQVGQTLTATPGVWTSNPFPPTYVYQWKSGTTNVGTNQNTYVPVTGDIGAVITCTVTATNLQGSASATSAATAAVQAAAAGGTMFYEDNFTEASSTPLTSHTSDSGATYTTVGSSTDFNVSSTGRTICGSTAERIVQASVVMPTQDADAEMLVSRPSDVGNAVGIGLRCENGVKGGYYWMLNDGSDLIQILRVSGGTTAVVATCPYTAATGDLPKPRIRTVGATAELSVLLAGVAQTLTVPATTGITAGADSKSLIDAAPLTGNRIHLRHNTAITSGNTGCELDRARAYSF